jgi:muramoyltetrapeptide carboxypeptidase
MQSMWFTTKFDSRLATNEPTNGVPSSVVARVSEFTSLIRNPSVNGMVASSGGVGASELLDLLPYDTIRERQIPIMGFSDITAILLAIYAHTSLVTFCGPTANVRAHDITTKTADERALRDALNALMDAPYERMVERVFSNSKSVVCVSKGRAEGVCLGGNMTVLCSMLGTEHIPSFEGCILFLEDINVDGLMFRRMLSQLQNAGVFDACNAIVFGTFENQPEDTIPTVEHVIADTFRNAPFPVAMGCNFSHGITTSVIPIGAHVAFAV